MHHHRFSELIAMSPESAPAPQQPQFPAGSYVLLPTTGYTPEQVTAIQQLYQQAWEQTQAEPRRNFRWEQAHQPRWN